MFDYANTNTVQSGYEGQLEAGDEADANTILEEIFLANLLESSSLIADAVSTFHDSFEVLYYEEFKGENLCR